MIGPKHLVSLLITPVYMWQTAKRVMLRELQGGFSVTEMWCECWNTKRSPWDVSYMNWWNISFINNIKYVNVIFNKRITWRLHTEMAEAKAFRTFIRNYSLFKIECLCANINLTLHKPLIRSVMTYACLPAEQDSLHHWKFSKVNTGLQFALGFQPSVCIWLYNNKIVQATIRSHTKSWVNMFAA
jgi:hypothetical protein